MERIGIYGGSFNPPHIGHIQAACCAADTLKLDTVFLIPARLAPHKLSQSYPVVPQMRLKMTQISVQSTGDPRLQVSDLELRRRGVSYTWQTVQHVRRCYPEAELFLLMGTDMFLSFLTWAYPERITQEVTLAVLYRGDREEHSQVEAQKQLLESQGIRVELVENPVVPISSTQLRRMLAFHCGESYLSPGVWDCIQSHGLYGTGRNYRNLPMGTLEHAVVSLLDPKRVPHVLGCRDTAVSLALRWNANETDAARAGILHDITKALDGPMQLTLCHEYGIMLNHFSTENPKTLHALTGSLVAERIFGENAAVVSAIRYHTTGRAAMSLLEKIIYVADYMEPCRDFPGVEQLRNLAYSDLDGALKLGLEMTLEHLKDQGSQVSPESQEALAYLMGNQ